MKFFSMIVAFLTLLTVSPCGYAQADVYTDNVVIVLDTSGSMQNDMLYSSVMRMSAAKSALKSVLKTIPESTHVGLLVFKGQSGGRIWMYPLGVRDDATLLEAIEKPVPRGQTPLGEFLKIGADRLLKARESQHGYGSYRLLIVTDGEASDQELVDNYIPEVKSRGITIDVIGVELNKHHTLATKVHSYRSADNPDSLKKAVSEVFAEVSSTRESGVVSEEFDLIAPLPYEIVASAIEALGQNNNRPIGKQFNEEGEQSTSPQKKAVVSKPAVAKPVVMPRTAATKSSPLFIIMILAFVGVVILGVIIRIIKN